MTSMTRQQLWDVLHSHALVEGDLPPCGIISSPWYIRIMLGVAGWIGALFLLAFVGLGFSFVLKNSAAAIVLGLLCCAAAYLIFRAAKDHDFATQFGLAVSLAGQALFIYGLFDSFKAETAITYLLVAAFELCLALSFPNFIHRVLTSVAAALAFSLALGKLYLWGLAPSLLAAGAAFIWLDEQRWAAQGAIWRPIGYGLTLAFLQAEAFRLLNGGEWYVRPNNDAGWWLQAEPWVNVLLVTTVLAWAAQRMLAREGVRLTDKAGRFAMAACLLVGALSFSAPGLAASLLILVLGFATGNRVLMGFGLLAIGGYVSHYYYQLHHTLLVKSLILAASGIGLLVTRWVLKISFPVAGHEEKQHA